MANDSSTPRTILKDLTPPVSLNVIYLVESFLVCFGNSLCILVFWRRRRSLRQTSYLLINLAVADLSSGVFSACRAVLIQSEVWNLEMLIVIYLMLGLAVAASIFSLTLVSLETAYAMVFPFRHRTACRRSYFFALTLVWILAALVSLSTHLSFVYYNYFFAVICIIVVIFGMCLILLSTSYLLIWWFVTKRSNRQIRERDQRKKLAVTLFIVTVLSLMTWIPGQLAFPSYFVKELDFKYTGHILTIILLSNSFLNPLVYTFRMPEFRKEIKTIVCKLQCCKLKRRAAAPSSPACHINMYNFHSVHEMGVLRSPCAQPQERNDNSANQLQLKGETLNPREKGTAYSEGSN